ncbi:hypothetical protein ABZ419_05105 [Streptomyces cinnamoneus]|uniref:hypothetical protein n=1 Tax=Streptomyces cinnamoneus TaxID=53446 RepID=UPI0033D35626
MTKSVGIDLTLSAHWRADDGKKSPYLPEGVLEFGWLGHLVPALERIPGYRARLLEEGELPQALTDVDVLLLPVPRGAADRELPAAELAAPPRSWRRRSGRTGTATPPCAGRPTGCCPAAITYRERPPRNCASCRNSPS